MLVLGVCATISYIGDPVGMFGHNVYEQEMLDILQSGHNVIDKENIDWGRFRSNLISCNWIRPNTIVLGSSRVMEISNEMLDALPLPNNRVFFNSWTASATLGDMISIFTCYTENGIFPNTIILGLGPSTFYKEGLFFPSLAKYYSIGLKQIGCPMPEQDRLILLDKKYRELISYPYVIAAMSKILRKSNHPERTDERYGEDWINLQDGRRSWPKSYREKTGARLESEIRAGQPILQTVGPSSEMNPNQIRLFDAFNRYLLKHHARVVFFLAPRHPITYDAISADHGGRQSVESEEYIRKYAKEKNIPVIGSFDPGLYNLTSSDFYDGSHPRPDAIARMFVTGDIGRRE